MKPASFAVTKAIAASVKSTGWSYKLGCCIYRHKHVLASGCNTRIYHAEVDTMLRATKPLKGTTMVVVRVGYKGQLRMAKPCNKCQEYIKAQAIKHVWFSNRNGTMELLQ